MIPWKLFLWLCFYFSNQIIFSPLGHSQWKELILSTHLPLLRQGWLAHSSVLMWQNTPSYPEMGVIGQITFLFLPQSKRKKTCQKKSSLLVLQTDALPGMQMQWNPPIWSRQVASLWQGLDMHSLTSISQRGPSYPWRHLHWKEPFVLRQRPPCSQGLAPITLNMQVVINKCNESVLRVNCKESESSEGCNPS